MEEEKERRGTCVTNEAVLCQRRLEGLEGSLSHPPGHPMSPSPNEQGGDGPIKIFEINVTVRTISRGLSADEVRIYVS